MQTLQTNPTDSIINELGIPSYNSNDTNNKFKTYVLPEDNYTFVSTLVFGEFIIHIHKSHLGGYGFHLPNQRKSFDSLKELIAFCKGNPIRWVNI
jgi:hypothetical protein